MNSTPIEIHRPSAGGVVNLNDSQLAQIGLVVVYEATAKKIISSVLRALHELPLEEWVSLERIQFRQLVDRLASGVENVSNPELTERYAELRRTYENHYELRNIIVHVAWADDGDGNAVGHDFGRQRDVTQADINQAVEGCAELKRVAHQLAMCVATLVADGILDERPNGGGMSIRTNGRLVNL